MSFIEFNTKEKIPRLKNVAIPMEEISILFGYNFFPSWNAKIIFVVNISSNNSINTEQVSLSSNTTKKF